MENDASGIIFKNGKMSHAYIAAGVEADRIAIAAVCSDPGVSPCERCRHCLKAARGIHPDISVIGKPPDKREIAVEQIRALKKDLIVVPCEAERKAYVIAEAESMNQKAQNALLLMLEEPPPHAVFILKTGYPSSLLPTVRSRCVEIKTAFIAPEGGRESSKAADEFFAALEQGGYALIRLMFRLEKLEKEAFAQFLASTLEQIPERLSGPPGDKSPALRALISSADRVLRKSGAMLDLYVSTGHISGFICASLLADER